MRKPSAPFWIFARQLLRYRVTAILALVMAFVSATSLSAGILTLSPVLENLLGEKHETLAELITRKTDKLPRLFPNGFPQHWLDALPTDRFQTVLIIVILLGILTVIGAAANFLHAYFSLTLTTMTIAQIRRSAFRRLVHLPLSTVAWGLGSDFTSRILNDTNILSRGFQALTSKAVAQATRGSGALIIAFILNWKISLATTLILPVLAYIIRKLGKRIRKASRGTMRSQAKLLDDAGEVIRGFRVVKVYTAERAEIGRFTRHNAEVVRETMKLRIAQAMASPLMETITVFVLGCLALVAAKAIIDQRLDPSDFILIFASLAMAGASLRPLTSVIQDIQLADAAATRLMELMRAEPEEHRTQRRPRLPRHQRDIEFKEVTFTYANAESPAIDRVSLTIQHGETVAFVGPNGCGKTTLLSLIPRLFKPDSGRILIDGVDIHTTSLRSLRHQIGVVTQETTLFVGTIATNIAYGSLGATRELIIEAARRAHAHDFISKLPQGYDTPVGEAGLTLSGGQRQRIAIARALLREPAILIMDEATSMIDSESEVQISTAISEFAGTRTILIVAHRLTTVLSAQRIVVMDRGRIIDTGRHDELLTRCPLYCDLTRSQLAPVAV